jgi:nucleoside-diphosphate-sugar epimerase
MYTVVTVAAGFIGSNLVKALGNNMGQTTIFLEYFGSMMLGF